MPINLYNYSVGDGNFGTIKCGNDLVITDAGIGRGIKIHDNWNGNNTSFNNERLNNLNEFNSLLSASDNNYSMIKKVHINISHMHMDHINLLPHVMSSIDKENNARALQGKPKIQLGEFVIGGEPSEHFQQKAISLFNGITNQRDDITNNFQFSILYPNSKSLHIWKQQNGQWRYTDLNVNTFQIPLSGANYIQSLDGSILSDNDRGIKNTFTIYSPRQQRPGGQNANSNYAVLRRGNSKAVYWGDATSEIQEESGLLYDKDVAFMVQSHHGSKYSMSNKNPPNLQENILSTGRQGDLAIRANNIQRNFYTRDGDLKTMFGSKKNRASLTRISRQINTKLVRLIYHHDVYTLQRNYHKKYGRK